MTVTISVSGEDNLLISQVIYNALKSQGFEIELRGEDRDITDTTYVQLPRDQWPAVRLQLLADEP